MGMFVLGLVVGCTGCALVATILFSALGLTIVGRKDRNKKKAEEKAQNRICGERKY